jgi:hypothetical protein
VSKLGHQLNEFEQRQLVECAPRADDFLRHDDESRTCEDVFGTYRDEQADVLWATAVLGWGVTWNLIQHMLLWKYRLRMRTFVELEWII